MTWPLVWVAVAAVAVNVAFLVVVAWLAGTPLRQQLDVTRSDILKAVPIGPDEVLVATLDNDVSLLRNRTVVAHRHFDAVVNDIAVAPGNSRFYIGTANGVDVLTSGLGMQAHIPVTGQVRALAMSTNGVVVGHGTGQYSDQYWVGRYPPGARNPAVQRQAVFTITALTVLGDRAIYGTNQSQVVAVGLTDGRQQWQASAQQPVTALLPVDALGGVLVGDEGGDLTVLGADGTTRGVTQVSSHAITALAYDRRTNTILVGDAHGDVHLLDASGKPLVTSRIGSGAVRTVAPLPSGGVLAVPENGRWSVLDTHAVGKVTWRARLVLVWIVVDVLALVAMVVMLIWTNTRRRAAAAQLGRRVWRGRVGYLFVLPALGAVGLFSYYPAVSAFYESLTSYSLHGGKDWVGLANYREVLTDDSYFRAGMVNMVIIVIASFLKTVTVPVMAAELVYWLRRQSHQYFFRTIFVWSAVVPGLVLTLLWRQVYDPRDGLLNHMLGAIGLGGLQRAWLGDEHTALWAIIGVGFPYLSTFAFLIFLGGLLAINRELYDSAALDGAGLWQRFRYIDLTHLLPQFRIMCFFAVTGAIESFAGIFILTRGGPGDATYVPALEMYTSIGRGELGYAAAIGVLLFIMVLAVTIVVLRFRRQETETSE